MIHHKQHVSMYGQVKNNFAKIFLLLLLFLCPALKVTGIKCHMCMFHLAHCTNPLDCYNQPDTCSNTNFSPLLTQVVDCEFGCEHYVITDATGSLVLWRRGCATQNSPQSSRICHTRNIYFLRHDQCWCHADYCNSSQSAREAANKTLLVVALIVIALVLL